MLSAQASGYAIPQNHLHSTNFLVQFKVAPNNCTALPIYIALCRQLIDILADTWAAFFMAMPGSFVSALLANICNRTTTGG